MRGLLIIGAGGQGKVVADTALLLGWDNVAFLDDRAATLPSPLGLPIVGELKDMEARRMAFPYAIIAVGDAALRIKLSAQCRTLGYNLISIVHPMAYVSKFAALGEGCAAFAQSAVNAGSVMGASCIVNTGATVDHDCVVGEAVHICPGAHLAGGVRVGDRTWIGIAATIRQGIHIGSDATVGAGAVVVSDVGDGSTVMGVPAKSKEKAL